MHNNCSCADSDVWHAVKFPMECHKCGAKFLSESVSSKMQCPHCKKMFCPTTKSSSQSNMFN